MSQETRGNTRPNQVNEEAIELAILKALEVEGWRDLTARELAQRLAARGVLAPSALTKAQQRVFAYPDSVIGYPAVVPHLERFARGDG